MTLGRVPRARRPDSFRRLVGGAVPSARALRWAAVELRGIRRRLPVEGTRARVAPVAGLGPRGWWGVRTAIAIVRPTCLERALVVQAWIGGYADAPDVVIGVRRRSGEVEAHAWVDAVDPWFDPSYEELSRLPA